MKKKIINHQNMKNWCENMKTLFTLIILFISTTNFSQNKIEEIFDFGENPGNLKLYSHISDSTKKMDGVEVTNLLKSKYDVTPPFIALTASGMKGDKEKCLAAGMNDYISKPINPMLLQDKLNHWLIPNN